MEVTIKKRNGVSVVCASGELDAVTCGKLEEPLNNLIDEGESRIILDLEGVTYISSAGLRVILSAAQRLFEKGQFVLCSLRKNVREIVELAGFTNIMDIQATTEKALKTIT